MRRHKYNKRVFRRPGWGDLNDDNPSKGLIRVPYSSEILERERGVAGEEGGTRVRGKLQ